jgi:chromosome segregation ATPase
MAHTAAQQKSALQKDRAQLDKDRKDFERDVKAFKKEQSETKAAAVRLKARNKALETDIAEKESILTDLNTKIDDQKEALASVKEDELEAERNLSRIEDELDKATTDLQHHRDQLAIEKSTIDGELNEYERQQKEQIKKNILAANATLVNTTRELTAVKNDLISTRSDLEVLTKTISEEKTDHETEVKAAEDRIAELKQQIQTLEASIETLTKEVAALNYDKHNAQNALKKVNDQHQKFKDYETRAWKKLNDKDQELQSRAATLQETSQFVKGRRSYLPEL